MNCNKCKYCRKDVISIMDSNNIITDIGTRIIKCQKRIDDIGENHSKTKYKKPNGVIGIIKEFDNIKYKEFIKFNIIEIKTPEWCPENKK